MFCPKCGNQLADSARFCGKCGYALATTPAAETPASKIPVRKAPRKKKKSGINWTVFFVMMLIGLLIIGGGAFVILSMLGVIDNDLFDGFGTSSSRDRNDRDEDEEEDTTYKLQGFKFDIGSDIDWEQTEDDSDRMEWEADDMELQVRYYEYGMSEEAVDDSDDREYEYDQKNGVNYSVITYDSGECRVSAVYNSGERSWKMTVLLEDEDVAEEYLDAAIDIVTSGKVPKSGGDNSSNDRDDFVSGEDTQPAEGEPATQPPTQDNVEEYVEESSMAEYSFGVLTVRIPGDFTSDVDNSGDEYYGYFTGDDMEIMVSGGSMEGAPDTIVDAASFAQWYCDEMIAQGYAAVYSEYYGKSLVTFEDENVVYCFYLMGDTGWYVACDYSASGDWNYAADLVINAYYG